VLLACRALEVRIGGIEVCRGLDIELAPGDVLGVLGANGTGKTTLLHTMAGLRPATSGSVLLDDQPIRQLPPRRRARRLGLVFQDHQDPLHASVMQTVLSARHPFVARFRGETEKDRSIAHNALERMGMIDKSRLPVSVLSGGERKRVALAALLAQQPACCLLDEPNAHLDLHHQISSLESIMEHLESEQGAAVMVLHDINLALRFCNRALLLFGNGDTVHGPAENVLNTENLTKLYRHQMKEFKDAVQRCFIPG
jgi:iron complex transport system ATP-binding protein